MSIVQVFMISTFYEYFKWGMFKYIWWRCCSHWSIGKVNLPGNMAGDGNWVNWTGFALYKGELAALLGGVVPFEFFVKKVSWNRTAYVSTHCHRSDCLGSAGLHLSLALFTRAKADAWSKRPWTLPRQKDGRISEERIIPGGWNTCSILKGELLCYPSGRLRNGINYCKITPRTIWHKLTAAPLQLQPLKWSFCIWTSNTGYLLNLQMQGWSFMWDCTSLL